MILNTGNRTDIPAYYSDWFYNRIREGCVLTRNPYYPRQVTRYNLTPELVDCICFCTKNPAPMLNRLGELRSFHQLWFVTITPYGKDIEPGVPDKGRVVESFKQLSRLVGKQNVIWRYDPIFVTEPLYWPPFSRLLSSPSLPAPLSGKRIHQSPPHHSQTGKPLSNAHKVYSLDFHIQSFAKLAEQLHPYTETCIISFIDLYEKTKQNFPQAREVTKAEQEALGKAFGEIGERLGLHLKTCCEGDGLKKYGIDPSGCMTKTVLEKAVGAPLDIPVRISRARAECDCLLGNDIGAYNTCGHGCVYCYANYDQNSVAQNRRLHDPASPFLIGNRRPYDQIKAANQESFLSPQLQMDLPGFGTKKAFP